MRSSGSPIGANGENAFLLHQEGGYRKISLNCLAPMVFVGCILCRFIKVLKGMADSVAAQSCLIYSVGYGVPAVCCCMGGIMTFYGCYKFLHRAHGSQGAGGTALGDVVLTEQPECRRVKADTLKRRMVESFTRRGRARTNCRDIHVNKDDSQYQSLKKEFNLEFCPICFEEYTEDPDTIFIAEAKSCKHHFHFYCLWEWLERNTTCPLCRESVTLKESDIKGASLTQVLEDIHTSEASKPSSDHNATKPDCPNGNTTLSTVSESTEMTGGVRCVQSNSGAHSKEGDVVFPTVSREDNPGHDNPVFVSDSYM